MPHGRNVSAARNRTPSHGMHARGEAPKAPQGALPVCARLRSCSCFQLIRGKRQNTPMGERDAVRLPRQRTDKRRSERASCCREPRWSLPLVTSPPASRRYREQSGKLSRPPWSVTPVGFAFDAVPRPWATWSRRRSGVCPCSLSSASAPPLTRAGAQLFRGYRVSHACIAQGYPER